VINVKYGIVATNEGDGEGDVEVPDDRLGVVLLDDRLRGQILRFIYLPQLKREKVNNSYSFT
jgi:hypothetical protein